MFISYRSLFAFFISRCNFADVVAIGQTQKSHKTPVPYPTIRHSEQKLSMHISVLNGVLWDMVQVQCGINEIGQFITGNTG